MTHRSAPWSFRRARGAALVAAVGAAALLSGCTTFARSGTQPEAVATTLPDGDVGSGVSIDRPPTTEPVVLPARPGPAPTASTAPPRDPRCPPPPANSQQTNHGPSGFSLGLTVSDRTCYGAKEPFFMTLSVVNTTRESRYHDPNQAEFFEIRGNGRRWGDRSCLPPQQEIDAPPSELGAGREAIFDARYPLPERNSDRNPDACRLPPGQYEVVGILKWCPPSANADGFCEPDESQAIRTPPVKIRIG